MQASPEPVSRALFPSSVTTMASRGATEAAVMDNLRLEVSATHRQEQAPGLELQPGTGSRTGDVPEMPDQTPQEKSYCSQVVMVSH